MGSLFHNFQKGGGSLPVSQAEPKKKPSCATDAGGAAGMRRRLSSLSLHIQPNSMISTSTSAATSWALRRSKSVSAMGETAGTSIRNWWEWGWSWILSRKPTFAQDLEMNEEESSLLGCHNKGSWRHVFYKVRSELRKLVGSDRVGLPQTVRYDSYNYSQNFDNGSNNNNNRSRRL